MLKKSDGLENVWNKFTPGPVQELPSTQSQARLRMMRLDLLESWASGNKYFKLKYTIQYALSKGVHTIVSKGGMFSNHLAALSEACSAFKIQLIAVIRSNMPDEMNPSIRRLRANGNEIIYIAPSAYKTFNETDAAQLFPGALFIPEGGLSEMGIRGTSEIGEACLDERPSHIVVAGGTMGTALGLMASLPSSIKVVIVPAWKGCTDNDVYELLDRYGIVTACSWELWPDYHFGGFGKFNQKLIDFMSSFSSLTRIPLDPVYTGKVMYAIDDKMKSGYFGETDSIMAMHTGGLQGLEGYWYRFPSAWGSYLP